MNQTQRLSGVRVILGYLKPYKLHLLYAFIALVVAATTVLGIGRGIKFLVDEGLNKGNATLLDKGLLAMVAAVVVLALATYSRYFFITWIGERVVADIRNDLYRRLVHFPLSFYEENRVGEIISRLIADTTVLQSVVGSSVSVAVRNVLLLLGGVVLLFLTSSKLSLYILLVVPAVVFPIIFLGKRVRRLSAALQDRVADLSAHSEETMGFIRTVQAYAREDEEIGKFSHLVQSGLDTAREKISKRAFLTAVVITLVFSAVGFVLWTGGHDVLEGRLSAGELASFLFYSIVVAGAVGAISEVAGELQKAEGAAERIVSLLASGEDPSPGTAHLPNPLRGAIGFGDVSFSYPAKPDKKALDSFSLNIAPGERIALVGPSGAGKSTVFQLLLRFYESYSGEITLDGVDTSELSLKELRDHIGLVSQDAVIFSGTALENIAYGKPGASVDEVIKAAEAAAAAEFLLKLPQGLNTYLGEKGVRLSGGQKQRISIARAILKNPRILLLDEATSALDSENEHFIQQGLEKLMEGRTTLVIAHRFATVKDADRIVVMNEGGIEDIGTHKELLSRNELYRRLAELQFRDF